MFGEHFENLKVLHNAVIHGKTTVGSLHTTGAVNCSSLTIGGIDVATFLGLQTEPPAHFAPTSSSSVKVKTPLPLPSSVIPSIIPEKMQSSPLEKDWEEIETKNTPTKIEAKNREKRRELSRSTLL
jgi:hypothetical protein